MTSVADGPIEQLGEIVHAEQRELLLDSTTKDRLANGHYRVTFTFRAKTVRRTFATEDAANRWLGEKSIVAVIAQNLGVTEQTARQHVGHDKRREQQEREARS